MLKILKGISGVGKGTRVIQLILYLSSRYQLIKHKDHIEIPKLNLIIHGRFTKKASWVGLDAIKTVDDIINTLTRWPNHNTLYEGYPKMHMKDLEYPYINITLGRNDISVDYFLYGTLDQCIDRCYNRNGGKIIKGSCWMHNVMYQRYAAANPYGNPRDWQEHPRRFVRRFMREMYGMSSPGLIYTPPPFRGNDITPHPRIIALANAGLGVVSI